MNVNSGNIGGEEESLNITNINLLNRFNKTREIFACVTSILLTTAAASVSVEKVNSKECVPNVPCSILAASYVEMSSLQ